MAISLASQPLIVPDTSVVIKWFRQDEILTRQTLSQSPLAFIGAWIHYLVFDLFVASGFIKKDCG